MGFRSSFVSMTFNIKWPDWFIEKYKDTIHFKETHVGPILSKSETKTYCKWADLPEDIQKSIDWDDFRLDFPVIYLHECGGITKCVISKDKITWFEPIDFIKTEGISHYYCGDCEI